MYKKLETLDAYFSNSKTTSTSTTKVCPTAGGQKLQDEEQCFLKRNNSTAEDTK